MLRLGNTGQFLPVDFPLEFHESVQQRFGPGRATRNVDIDRDIAVDPLEHIVALFEWSARNGTGAHGNNVLRIGHLVVEPNNLWRHFLRDRAGDNHEVGLAGRWPEHFPAKTRNVVTRSRRGDHFNRATGQPELQRPDRVTPAPIVEVLHRGHPDPLSLQFVTKSLVDLLSHSPVLTM